MNLKKAFALALNAVTVVYTIWYMHYGQPFENSGALSKIGLRHHGLFVIWGILTMLNLSLGIICAYKRLTKTKIYIPLLAFAGAGMLLTLCFDFDFDKKPDYYLHCAGSLVFSAVMGITIFLLFFLCRKASKIYLGFMITAAIILLGDLVLLLIFKETGFIEVFPIFSGYILLGITNLRRDKIEAYNQA